MVDDATLLCRYAATRSEEAFAELVRRHIGGVYSAALRRVGGDAHLAEDVAQKVFVALARKAAALSKHPYFASWLFVSTRNEAANVVRSERRRKAREKEANAMQEIPPTPNAEDDWRRVGPVLDEVLDELSELDRTAVLLRFVDRRAYAEIGARLQLREDAARMRIDRALNKLRVRLARRGITSTAAALSVVLTEQAAIAVPAGVTTSITGTALALAGAGGAASMLTPVLLMTTTQKAAAAAAIVALLAVGGALREYQTTRQITAERDAAERQLAGLQRQYRAVTEESAASKDGSARVPNPPPATAVPSSSATQALTTSIEAEQMRLFLATEWANLAGGALPLIEKLGVSAEQRARYSALIDRELEGTYLPGPMAIERHRATLREKWERETRALIGDERFERLKELQAAQAAIHPIAKYFDHWDVSLTGQQANRMLELFDANRAAIHAAGSELPEPLMPQMQQILSPAQLEFLRRFQRLAETQRRLTEHLRAQDAATAAKRSGG